MADDLKISEMGELLSGDLHDDLLFEIVDLTEAAVEDQNKKVKLLTLEDAFGAEDKIFEGDSSVEVIDAGTGQIDTTVDAQLLSRYTLAQLYFQVNGGDNGVNPYIDLNGTLNTLYLGYQGDTHLRVGIGSSATIRAMSGTDTWFYVHPDQQYLGSLAAGDAAYIRTNQAGVSEVHLEAEEATDVSFIKVLGDQLQFSVLGTQWMNIANDAQRLGLEANEALTVNQSSNTIRAYIAGATEMLIDTSGMKLKTGASVNEIETTLTNDDTHLPTSGAVFDAIAAIPTNSISQLDSNITVLDAGTGNIEVTVDGTEVANFLLAYQRLGQSGGERVIVDQTANQIQLQIAATDELVISSSGITLKTGATVNDIETTLTDDDTHLPTSGAVWDAIAALQPDKIEEGDSSVEVIDAGTGQIDIKADNNLRMQITNAQALVTGAKLVIDDGTAANKADFEHAVGNFYITNYYDGGSIQIRVQKAVDVTQQMIAITPGGSVQSNYDGVLALRTKSGGIQVFAGGTGPGDLGFNGNDLELVNLVNGGDVLIAGRNALGSPQNLFKGNTDGASIVYHSGVPVIETIGSYGFILYGDSGSTQSGRFWLTGNDLIIENDQAAGETRIRINSSDKAIFTDDGLELKDDQTGAAAIGNAATSVSVTFGTAHADANYQVLCTMENTTDGSPLFLIPVVTAKATTGFTVTLSAATDSANYVLNWMVLRS